MEGENGGVTRNLEESSGNARRRSNYRGIRSFVCHKKKTPVCHQMCFIGHLQTPGDPAHPNRKQHITFAL